MRVDSAVEPTRSENINGDLAALGGILGPRFKVWRFRSRTGKLPDRTEHFQPVPKRQPEVSEMLIGQVGKDREINAVFGKPVQVLGHAEFFQPVGNLLHRGPLRI